MKIFVIASSYSCDCDPPVIRFIKANSEEEAERKFFKFFSYHFFETEVAENIENYTLDELEELLADEISYSIEEYSEYKVII